MRELNLAPGVSFFERQIQADQRKRDADIGFRRHRVLQLPGVHSVLVDEPRVGVRERVGAEFTEQFPA